MGMSMRDDQRKDTMVSTDREIRGSRRETKDREREMEGVKRETKK